MYATLCSLSECLYCLKVSTWGDSLTQVKVTERGNLLTSAGPGLISLWRPNSRPLAHFRGKYMITICIKNLLINIIIYKHFIISTYCALNIFYKRTYNLNYGYPLDFIFVEVSVILKSIDYICVLKNYH